MASRILVAVLASLPALVDGAALKRDLQSPVVDGWTALGCYTDSTASRSLQGGYLLSGSMTIQACTSYCSSKGYTYAGTEYSSECFCADVLQQSATPVADSDCDMACNGDATQPCGGNTRITIYKSLATSGRGIAPPISGFNYLGCYTDRVPARTLTIRMSVESAMTASKCMNACRTEGFKYAGVEFAGECYCGNDLLNGGHLAEDGEAMCNMACDGDDLTYCGGPDRLNLYVNLNANPATTTTTVAPSSTPSKHVTWAYYGCIVDDVAARVLRNGVDVQGGYLNMTVEGCTKACQNLGFSIAGLEYSQECFCDNEYQSNGGAIAPDGDQGCNMPCKGRPQELCGGPNRLNVYTVQTDGVITTSTTTHTSSETTTTTTPEVTTTTNLEPTTTTTTSESTTTTAATTTTTTITTTESTATTTTTTSDPMTTTTSESPTTTTTTTTIVAEPTTTTTTTIVPEPTTTTTSVVITTTTTTTTMTTTTSTTSTTTTAAATPTPSDLLKNGGFENGDFSPWSFVAPTIGQPVSYGKTAEAYNGTGALAFSFTGSQTSYNQGELNTYALFRQKISATVGNIYRVRFRYKLVTKAGGSAGCSFGTGYSQLLASIGYASSVMSAYSTFDASFAIFDETADFFIGVYCPAGSIFLFDDVSVVSGSRYPNIFQNPAFDTISDTTSWYLNVTSDTRASPSFTIDTAAPLSGRGSAKITYTTTNTYGNSDAPRVWLSQNLLPAIGKTYYLAHSFKLVRNSGSVSNQCSMTYSTYFPGQSAPSSSYALTLLKYGQWGLQNTGAATLNAYSYPRGGTVVFSVGMFCVGPPASYSLYLDDFWVSYTNL